MSYTFDGKYYEDVFVFDDLVYAMEPSLGVSYVYGNSRNSLIKLNEIRYPCRCNDSLFSHSIIVTKEHIIKCCARFKFVYIMDRSGKVLRRTTIAHISGGWPILRQVDTEGNILFVNRETNRLVIANVNRPSSQWGVVNLANFPGLVGVIWFRHRLHVASFDHMSTFTPAE